LVAQRVEAIMTHAEIIRRHPIAKISRVRGRDRSLQQLRAEIRCLRFVQTPFSWVFWLLEQRISRIADEIERVQS
jgi:hypothetical protein